MHGGSIVQGAERGREAMGIEPPSDCVRNEDPEPYGNEPPRVRVTITMRRDLWARIEQAAHNAGASESAFLEHQLARLLDPNAGTYPSEQAGRKEDTP